MANLPSSDFQSRSLDFYPVAATVFPSIFVHETRDAHSVVRIRVNETGEARGKESIYIEENCARIPFEMGFWVRETLPLQRLSLRGCF